MRAFPTYSGSKTTVQQNYLKSVDMLMAGAVRPIFPMTHEDEKLADWRFMSQDWNVLVQQYRC